MFEGDLLRSIAVPVVLRLLNEKAMYGYEIIKEVHNRTNGEFQWKEGTLYPCLHRMEGEGLIKSEWQKAESGRKRKYYLLTTKGKKQMEVKVAEWGKFVESVNSLFIPFKDAPQA